MTQNVLVTGGAGFIGRRLVDALVQRAHDVTVLDRTAGLDVQQPSVRWIQGSTCDWERVVDAVHGQDAIIHLAAGSNFLMYEAAPVEQTTAAIEGFHALLEAAARAGVRKIVYASTSAVYEGNEPPYTERTPTDPPDLKAFAKMVNERMAHLYSRRYGISAIGLRPFSVYGEGEHSKGPYANVISLFAWAMSAGEKPLLWGDGEQTRDFIYVDDAVEAFVLALGRDLPTQELNVGTGVETSFNQVIAMLNRQLGTSLEPDRVPVPIGIYARRLLADPSLAERMLGFKSRVQVADGISRVLCSARPLIEADKSALPAMQRRFAHHIP